MAEGQKGQKGSSKDWKKFQREKMIPLENDSFVAQLVTSLKEADDSKPVAKRGRPKGRTDEEIAQAIIAAGGFISRAAEMLNVHYSTIYQRIQKTPALQSLTAHIDEKLLDYGELELIKAMKRGESWAICFYLKCKGKGRGYVEKQTVISTKDDNSIQIVIE